MKISYDLSDKSNLKWREIVNSIPKTRKKVLKENQIDSSNLVLLDHQLLKNSGTLGIEKMNSKEIYSIVISSKVNIATSKIYFQKKFLSIVFNGKTLQLCSFCKMEEETISHLFYYCTHIQYIWNQVRTYFTDCFHFSQLAPQTATFGFHNIDNDTFLI